MPLRTVLGPFLCETTRSLASGILVSHLLNLISLRFVLINTRSFEPTISNTDVTPEELYNAVRSTLDGKPRMSPEESR